MEHNIDDLFAQAMEREGITSLVHGQDPGDVRIYRNMFRLGYEAHNAPTKPLAALLRAPS